MSQILLIQQSDAGLFLWAVIQKGSLDRSERNRGIS